jgi:hypothetical protein
MFPKWIGWVDVINQLWRQRLVMKTRLPVDLLSLAIVGVKIAVGTFAAGLFYFIWLGAYLLVVDYGETVLDTVMYLAAPVITGAGFALGVEMVERRSGGKEAEFIHVFAWTVAGCAVGAGIVYWFGPMLIVFGMFLGGVASLVLRELVFYFREKDA